MTVSKKTQPYTEEGMEYINKNQNKKERASLIFFKICNISVTVY